MRNMCEHHAADLGRLWYQLQTAVRRAPSYQPNLIHLDMVEDDEDLRDPVVSSTQRDDAVDRLRCLNRCLRFKHEAFALAVNILDRFLSIMKELPSPVHLIRISQCRCTEADLFRMEGIVCQKLYHDFGAVTPLTLLQLYHGICAMTGTMDAILEKRNLTPAEHLERTIAKLEACLCRSPFTKFTAPVLAMSLLMCDLDAFDTRDNNPDLCSTLNTLKVASQINEQHLVECQKKLEEFLLQYSSPVSRRPTSRFTWVLSSRTARQLRPSMQWAMDLPTILEDGTDGYGSYGSSEEDASSEDDSPRSDTDSVSSDDDDVFQTETEKSRLCLTCHIQKSRQKFCPIQQQCCNMCGQLPQQAGA
ncbi:cyclin-G1-like isoform X3 [Branchiostoma floridae]|uniref:Cyclin-G1-like isoform X3 n=1 Tax=Branchiostoma floridae TaxID=7739 RepID=A0A9J7MVY4_BRAFL|nr:cyclin-G1-like isoform X3 [Branchiostoma floridae]